MWIRNKNRLYNTDKFDIISLNLTKYTIFMYLPNSDQPEGFEFDEQTSAERVYDEIMASLSRGDKFYDINEA